jgi:Cu2+-exporting ATPase
MFIEICLLSCGLHAGSELYKKIKCKLLGSRPISDNNHHKSDEKNIGQKTLTLLDDIYEAAELKIHSYLGAIADVRRQQLISVECDQDIALISQEKSINRNIVIGAIALLINTAGTILYPPLMWISLPYLAYHAIIFIRKAYAEVKQGKVGIMTLVAITITGMLLLKRFWIQSFFNLLFLINEKVLSKTRDASRRQLVNILGNIPDMVWMECDGVEIEMPVEKLQPNDRIIVHTGEMIPVDGVIVRGFASIDQHKLTGEAKPIEKAAEDPVYAGTIVLSGTITVLVEQAGEDTVAAHIGDILNRTADYRLSLELQGESIADRSVLPSLILSGITWAIMGPGSAIAILACSIGYQIRYTGPLSVLNFLHISSNERILIKDGRALELVPNITAIVFDKTGTLTQDQPYIANINSFNGYSSVEVLCYAASAEYKQTHPIARAILEEASARKLDIPTCHDAVYNVGYGLTVSVKGKQVKIGSSRFIKHEGIRIPESSQKKQDDAYILEYSEVYVAIDEQLAGVIELRTAIRPEAQDIIKKLKARNLTLYIMSGDHEQPTRQLAQAIGIDHYFAEVLPEHKSALIEQLQQQGNVVCFVGDGINDSIALKKSDVSVSMRGAASIAVDTAQVILMDGGLTGFEQLFELADGLKSNMQVNFLASTIPGIISVSGVYLFHFGIFTASLLSWLGLTTGLMNAMRPALEYKGFGKNAVSQENASELKQI